MFDKIEIIVIHLPIEITFVRKYFKKLIYIERLGLKIWHPYNLGGFFTKRTLGSIQLHVFSCSTHKDPVKRKLFVIETKDSKFIYGYSWYKSFIHSIILQFFNNERSSVMRPLFNYCIIGTDMMRNRGVRFQKFLYYANPISEWWITYIEKKELSSC